LREIFTSRKNKILLSFDKLSDILNDISPNFKRHNRIFSAKKHVVYVVFVRFRGFSSNREIGYNCKDASFLAPNRS